MKTKRIIGYVIAIIGLLTLIRNAYLYLSQSEAYLISTGAALFLCVVGAVMIRKYRDPDKKA